MDFVLKWLNAALTMSSCYKVGSCEAYVKLYVGSWWRKACTAMLVHYMPHKESWSMSLPSKHDDLHVSSCRQSASIGCTLKPNWPEALSRCHPSVSPHPARGPPSCWGREAGEPSRYLKAVVTATKWMSSLLAGRANRQATHLIG